MREAIEYWLVVAVARAMGRVPRKPARWAARLLAITVYWCFGRLRRVGARNLQMALPELSPETRTKILRGVYIHLAWQLVEFCRMPRYTVENTRTWMRTEGLNRFLAAQAKGKGVLIVTGHLGAWEVSSFYHSLMGHPMGMVIRRLDNRRLDAFVNSIRCMHGNWVLHKDDFGRGLLTAMHKGQTVGILMDTNMTPPQGEFVDFFGISACTATGLAHVARKTGAAVLPGFMLWGATERRYVLHFGEEIEIPHTDDVDRDIVEGTRRCTAAIEAWIRRYPDQWLWIHRRWKTRPAGEAGLY
ncbi:MAG TPA: lysophospholipid acyltransferase family protein [Terracidiphilus sp.]|nr:lysophospholipid acyltransferase family protein [Terracidiphilus sp.]